MSCVAHECNELVKEGVISGKEHGAIVSAIARSTCARACGTCASVGAVCGAVSDGCGGTLDCGTCPRGSVCSTDSTGVNCCQGQ